MNISVTKKPFEEQIHFIIIIGILWGLLELFLMPVFRSNARGISGIAMPFISVTFVLIARAWMPTKGTVFLSAVIGAMIKFFLGGMVLKGAFMAILIEATIIEFIYLMSGFALWGYIASGILVQLYSAFHPWITKGLLCQSSHFLFFKKFLNSQFDFHAERTALIVILLTAHIIMGLMSGLLAWWTIGKFKH